MLRFCDQGLLQNIPRWTNITNNNNNNNKQLPAPGRKIPPTHYLHTIYFFPSDLYPESLKPVSMFIIIYRYIYIFYYQRLEKKKPTIIRSNKLSTKPKHPKTTIATSLSPNSSNTAVFFFSTSSFVNKKYAMCSLEQGVGSWKESTLLFPRIQSRMRRFTRVQSSDEGDTNI